MMMFLMSFFLWSLTTAAFVLPMTIRRRWKYVLAGLIFIGAFKGHILYKLGGSHFFAPDLPLWVLHLTTWYYAVIFFLFALLMIAWFFYGLFLLYILIFKKESHWTEWRKKCSRINVCLAAAALLLSVWSLFNGAQLPDVKDVTIHIRNLPESAKGMTIVVLTDLHINKLTPERNLPAIVKKCNDLHPDLIVLLGDFADGAVTKIGRKLVPLKQLRAKYGCYAVPGNHEYYSGYRDWLPFLSGLGIHFLLNESVCLPNGLWLAGTTDPAAVRRKEIPPLPDAAAKNIPVGSAALLLAHNPKVHSLTHGQYALQLSGHTHGGMIIGFDYIVGLMNDGFVSGLYQVGNEQVYVSNGTAIWQCFPIRLFCPPEITFIRLF